MKFLFILIIVLTRCLSSSIRIHNFLFPTFLVNCQSAKNDYLQGFVEGVLKALKDNEEKYALMVVVPNAVVEYTKKRTVMSRKTMKSVFGSAVARSQGFSDGQYSQNARNVAITD